MLFVQNLMKAHIIHHFIEPKLWINFVKIDHHKSNVGVPNICDSHHTMEPMVYMLVILQMQSHFEAMRSKFASPTTFYQTVYYHCWP